MGVITLHFLIKDNKGLCLNSNKLELLPMNTKRDSIAKGPRSHALRGNAYRKALPSIWESQLLYDPHVCMYPKTEAEPENERNRIFVFIYCAIQQTTVICFNEHLRGCDEH